MRDKPLVSIILPTYNRSSFLPLAIESCLNQTYENLELIIVDDHSQDNTARVVQQYSDKRIRYIRNEQNLKLPASLNQGHIHSKGAVLTWTSDDNEFAANAIEKMVEHLLAEQVDFVFTDYVIVENEKPESLLSKKGNLRLLGKPDLSKGNGIGACFLYTRQAYAVTGAYDPEIYLAEDFDYWIRISKNFKLSHLPESLYFYRSFSDSLYSKYFQKVKLMDLLVRFKHDLISLEAVSPQFRILLLNSWNDEGTFNIAQRFSAFAIWYFRLKRVLKAYKSGTISFAELKEQSLQISRIGK